MRDCVSFVICIDIDCTYELAGETSRGGSESWKGRQHWVSPVVHLLLHDWVECVEDKSKCSMKDERVGVSTDMVVEFLGFEHVFHAFELSQAVCQFVFIDFPGMVFVIFFSVIDRWQSNILMSPGDD